MTWPPTREQDFQAVFGLVQPLPQFKVVTRRYIRPSAVEAINTPILMTWEQPEKTEGGDIGLRKRWWEVWLIIVYYNNDQNVAGATILNLLIDAVEGALAPGQPGAPNPDLARAGAGGLHRWRDGQGDQRRRYRPRPGRGGHSGSDPRSLAFTISCGPGSGIGGIDSQSANSCATSGRSLRQIDPSSHRA